MIISKNFQGLYFALLNDAYLQLKGSGKVLMTFNKFRENIKIIDINYPRYEKTMDAISLKDINNKDLIQHVEFIIKFCAERGINLEIINQEWERLMQQAHEK